jgi:hypothetical protein
MFNCFWETCQTAAPIYIITQSTNFWAKNICLRIQYPYLADYSHSSRLSLSLGIPFYPLSSIFVPHPLQIRCSPSLERYWSRLHTCVHFILWSFRAYLAFSLFLSSPIVFF